MTFSAQQNHGVAPLLDILSIAGKVFNKKSFYSVEEFLNANAYA
jgi:hypothetical protein